MDTPVVISEGFAVAKALSGEDFALAAGSGFKTIVSLLPDGERPDLPSSHQTKVAAAKAGLAFVHLPASKFELFADATVDAMGDALATLPAPVLATCASGQRAAIVWAATAARTSPVDHVLNQLDRKSVV